MTEKNNLFLKPNQSTEEKIETPSDPLDPIFEKHPELVTARHLNNFLYLMPGGSKRCLYLTPEILYKVSKQKITSLRKQGKVCNPNETFRENTIKLIVNKRQTTDEGEIQKELEKIMDSPKKLGTKIKDFCADIDRAITECGLDSKEIEKKMKQAYSYSVTKELNDLILPVYKRLRSEKEGYGYSHFDLIL